MVSDRKWVFFCSFDACFVTTALFCTSPHSSVSSRKQSQLLTHTVVLNVKKEKNSRNFFSFIVRIFFFLKRMLKWKRM